MHNVRRSLIGLAAAAVLALAACGSGAASGAPTVNLPTFPPDDMASGTAACVDAPTMAIIDQLRATGADVPALLAANKDALVAGLQGLETSDSTTAAWRDDLVAALQSDDTDAAAAQIARLANDEVTITPC